MKAKFTVYENNNGSAAYVMAYICHCGEPAIGYGDDPYGMFVGRCGNRHESTVMAS